ncbi:MAG: peptide MFS transporter [Candidatus Gastranaerophilales bacterium]|nr:peptide MFS transporter [Candidatus Gastranaerophilales bacterium]
MLKNLAGGHPKGLYLLFSVEMWERFSYYGMRAMLVLYMIEKLSFNIYSASSVYGFYTGFVYLTPLLGGYLADRFLGQRKSISIGAIVMLCGLMALASGIKWLFFPALTLMIIGNGFFKSNISTIVGMLYGEDKQKKDAGFTIFYMGINLGAFFSPLVCGTLAMKFGYNYGFAAAGVGMLLGYITYKLGEKSLLGEHGLHPVAKRAVADDSEKKELTLRDKRKIGALFILMLFSICFWICFEQAGCSLTLFAKNSTQRVFGNFEIAAEYFQSLNPLFIITLAPLMSMLWGFLASKGKEPTSVVKFCMALTLISLATFIMAMAAHFTHGNTYLVSPFWLFFAYFTFTVAELCLSPIGLSLVTKLAPAQFASLLMGTWFLSSFVGNLAAGLFAGFYDTISHTVFFLILSATAFVIAMILTSLIPVLKLWMGKN